MTAGYRHSTERSAWRFCQRGLPNSGSAKAGVKLRDVIISLNGKPLNSFYELRSRIATTEPGTKVKLGSLRDGKPLEVEVAGFQYLFPLLEMIALALQGATLSDGQLKDGRKALALISKSSPAAQAGLQKMMLSSALTAIASVLSPKCAQSDGGKTVHHCSSGSTRQRKNIYLLLRYLRLNRASACDVMSG